MTRVRPLMLLSSLLLIPILGIFFIYSTSSFASGYLISISNRLDKCKTLASDMYKRYLTIKWLRELTKCIQYSPVIYLGPDPAVNGLLLYIWFYNLIVHYCSIIFLIIILLFMFIPSSTLNFFRPPPPAGLRGGGGGRKKFIEVLWINFRLTWGGLDLCNIVL